MTPGAAPEPLTIEAEQALLGCVLTEPSLRAELGHLRAEHFSEPFHGRAWDEMGALVEGGRTLQFSVLKSKLQGDPAFEALGGVSYLADLLDKAPPPRAAADQATVVVEGWTKRAGAEYCRLAAAALTEAGARPPSAILAEVRAGLEQIEQEGCGPDDGLISADDAGTALVADLDREAVEGRERGAMTGLRCIDRRLRGLRPGWLVVIGGRPSMGKTALARAAAYGCAQRNPAAQVLFFALEMDRREITERALAALSFVHGEAVQYVDMGGSSLHPEDRATLRMLSARLPRNLLIDDRSSLSVDDVRRKVWAAKRRGPLAAVFIDYLQLMQRPAAQGRNDAAVIGEMTSTLKRIAKEAGTCIVLLSQLSRGVESRDDKRPQLADLRESGSIEQDANAVLFPFRPVYYTERAEPQDTYSTEHTKWRDQVEQERRRLDVIAAKVRGGAIGTDRQACFIEYDHCVDVEPVQ